VPILTIIVTGLLLISGVVVTEACSHPGNRRLTAMPILARDYPGYSGD